MWSEKNSSKMINWDSFDPNMRALVSIILCIPYFSSWKVRVWLPANCLHFASYYRSDKRVSRRWSTLQSVPWHVPALYRAASTLGSHWNDNTFMLFFQGKGLRKEADAVCLCTDKAYGMFGEVRSTIKPLYWFGLKMNRTWCPYLYYLYELLFIMTSWAL